MANDRGMNLGMEGQVALVTGGSRGIGAAVAVELARHGCDVALTFVGEPDEAAETVAAIEALGRRALPLVANAARSSETEDAVASVVNPGHKTGPGLLGAGLNGGQ